MDVAIIIISVLVFLGCTTYVVLMIYFPEWVGITGKSARQTMAEHVEGSKVDDADIFAGESARARTPPRD